MQSQDPGAEAAERAAAAGRRTKEIADRLTRLAEGRRSETSDVEHAQEHAGEARKRAQESFRRAMAGHERAARSHERAAQAHEEAARRGIGDPAEHERQAEQHRDAETVDQPRQDVARLVVRAYAVEDLSPDEYELDALITPELGGTVDAENLWPQRYAGGVWTAYVKDEIEDHLRDLVCAGRLELTVAQQDMARNWIAAYQKYFHRDLPRAEQRVSTEHLLMRASGPSPMWVRPTGVRE